MKMSLSLWMVAMATITLTLAGCGKSGSVDPLLKQLKDEKSDRRAAIIALGKLRDERAVPALVEVLSGKDDFLPFDALRALGNIGGTGVDALVKVMNDDSSRWTLAAVKVLAESGDSRAVVALTEKAKGKSGMTRASARSALRDMKRRNAGQASSRLTVKPIEWPKGAGYLPNAPARPSARHDVKKTSSVAEIIAVSGSQFLFGESSQVEYRESESLFIFPGSQISYYADDPEKLVLSDYNGASCTLIYGLTVTVNDSGQFVPLKYDPAGF